MDNASDLTTILRSRHPLVVVDAGDEKRLIALLRRVAEEIGLEVWFWSSVRGLAKDGQPPQYDTQDAFKALTLVSELTEPGLFVFADAHHAMKDPKVARMVKEMIQWSSEGQTLMLTVEDAKVHPDLKGLSLRWTLKPPSQQELSELVVRTIEDLKERDVPVELQEHDAESLIGAIKGLSLSESEQAIQQAAFRDGKLDADDVSYLRAFKAEVLSSSGSLELVEGDHGTLDMVGGLHGLKNWLAVRGKAMTAANTPPGIDAPRGVLITGVPGCGKSLVAKTLARTWDLPLLLLDPSRLYGPYIGESEQRLRDALETVEAMAPVVLWIDEIEKGLATAREGDGGVSRRLLGTFLRWMQERPDGIFLVATSNDVSALPPELLRKGRFDEIFFVDLPNQEDRGAIFRLHLHRRNLEERAFRIEELVRASEGFSGAEIEASVVAAVYRAFAEDRTATDADVLEELRSTHPLSQTRAEDIARLRTWASERARPA